MSEARDSGGGSNRNCDCAECQRRARVAQVRMLRRRRMRGSAWTVAAVMALGLGGWYMVASGEGQTQSSHETEEPSGTGSPPHPEFTVDDGLCGQVDVSPVDEYFSLDGNDWPDDIEDGPGKLDEYGIGDAGCEVALPLPETDERDRPQLQFGVSVYDETGTARYKYANPYPPDAPTEDIFRGVESLDLDEVPGCDRSQAESKMQPKLSADETDYADVWIVCTRDNVNASVGISGLPVAGGDEAELQRMAEAVLAPLLEETLTQIRKST